MLIVAGVVGVGLVGAGIATAVVRFQREGGAHPGRLLDELFEAHGLSGAERRVLQQMASGLEQPAMLLTVPEQFDAVLAQSNLAPHEYDAATLLRQRIFAPPSC